MSAFEDSSEIDSQGESVLRRAILHRRRNDPLGIKDVIAAWENDPDGITRNFVYPEDDSEDDSEYDSIEDESEDDEQGSGEKNVGNDVAVLPSVLEKDNEPASFREAICIICEENAVRVVPVPCGHAHTCLFCWQTMLAKNTILNCATCRSEVRQVIRLYVNEQANGVD